MKRIFTLGLFSLILLSCGDKKNKAEIVVDLELDAKLNSINEDKKYKAKFDDQEVKVEIIKNENGFTLSTKKKSTLLSKRELDFFWISSEDDQVIFKQLVSFQKALKAQKLIGFDCSLMGVQFKDTLGEAFYQEGIEKQLIESNSNREGILFSIVNEDLDVLSTPKGITDEGITKLKSRIQSWKTNVLATQCLFDWEKTITVLSTLKAFNLSESKHISFVYYLNPVSNLIEPYARFEKEATADNVRGKLEGDNQLMASLSFTDEQKSLVESSGIELKTFKAQNLFVDTVSCFNQDAFLKYFHKQNGKYILKDNQTVISDNVIAPKGVKIEFSEGQKIDLINDGFILSFSPVQINGLTITTSDSSGRGLHVINAKLPSSVKNATFDGLKNLEFMNWKLPSAVTFYESPVTVKNSKFLNNQSEDGLNLFRSYPFVVDSCLFENTFSDAFDADFSDGLISNTTFRKLGNDGIDVSGSQVKIVGCTFIEVADKALSSGEASAMDVDQIVIDGASLAITAKDKSSIKIANSEVKNSEVVFCAFQKKKEFGPSVIEGTNIKYNDFKKDFLIETKSSLTLDGKSVDKYTEDVRGILYGNEFGKATVK